MAGRRCINCMELIDDDTVWCQRCGYDQREQSEFDFGMKPETILRGRYLVGRILGQGGFGLTYMGYDLTLDLKVAIKEYYPTGLVSRNNTVSNQIKWNTTQYTSEQWQQDCDGFLKEARQMAKLDSLPGIVRVRDTFPENHTAYIVMDFIEGETLKSRLMKTGKMTGTECVKLLAPLMESLAKMHKRGLIHRDISPDNIMILPDGSACLLDFGAAKDVSMQQNAASRQIAKKGFSPPEQYTEGGIIGSWTDVYALCATIYYCVTGRMVPDAMERLYNDSLTFGEALNDALDGESALAVMNGLKVRHEERTQTVDELLSHLLKAAENKNLDSGGADKNTEIRKEGKTDILKKAAGKINKKIVGIAGAAVVCLALAIWLFSGRDSQDDDTEPQTEVITSEVVASGTAESEEVSSENAVDAVDGIAVEKLGTSNANLLNCGGFAQIPGEYEYYAAADSALYVCRYDAEDETFYLGDGDLACDDGAYITLGDEAVFFITDDGKEHSVCSMDFDGGNVRKLYTAEDGRGLYDLQYAKLSDGHEYLYFRLENEKDSELKVCGVYRYDLAAGSVEPVIEGDTWWYNLYGGFVYYTEIINDGVTVSKLVRADLDGANGETLDEGKAFLYGFIEDDAMYLYSNKEETVLACGLDGEKNSGFYDCDIDFSCNFGYGDGWFYYTGMDGNMHRVRANGSGDSVIAEGHTAVQICYVNEVLWFVENIPTDKERYYTTQVGVAYKDGTSMFSLREPELSWMMYTANAGDFEYTEREDGKGIVINGYDGGMTQFAIPDEIDGRPVVEIGDEAFMGSGVVEVGIPDGVERIGESAFYQCSDLTFAGLPDSVTEIAYAAFGECASLTRVDLPEELITIGDMAFCESGLCEVRIPSKVEDIGAAAFAVYPDTGLTEFQVDEANESLEAVDGVLFAVSDDILILCAYPSGREGAYEIPDGTKAIYYYAFAHCQNLAEVIVPKSVVMIGSAAFFDSGVSQITVSGDCAIDDDIGGEITVNRY